MTKLKNHGIFITGLLVILFTYACNKHVVIPPPVNIPPAVDLECEFSGIVTDTINSGTQTAAENIDLLYQDNVNDYGCFGSFQNEIVPSPGNSTARYWVDLESAAGYTEKIRFEVGKIEWIAEGAYTSHPDSTTFIDYFLVNDMPPFSPNVATDNGVRIVWTDATGVEWVSVDTSSYNSFQFTNIESDYDTTGHYVLFDAELQCLLRDTSVVNGPYFKYMNLGHLKSSFKLEN